MINPEKLIQDYPNDQDLGRHVRTELEIEKRYRKFLNSEKIESSIQVGDDNSLSLSIRIKVSPEFIQGLISDPSITDVVHDMFDVELEDLIEKERCKRQK